MNLRSLALLAAFAAISASHAAVLVSFDMSTITGSGASRSVSVTSVDPGLTSTGLLKNNILSTSPVNTVLYGGNASSSWGTSVAQTTVDVSTTLTNANYFYFTVTPLEGQTMSISSISFGAAASGTNLRSFYLLSNVTGYATSSVLLSDATDATLVRRSSGALKSYSLTLTDPTFSNISTATTFRFYLQTAAVNQELDFDNITLNGTVSAAAVPEPSTYALLASGLALGVAVVGRRRRS